MDLDLLRPLWLLGLPILLAIGWWLWKRPAGLGAWADAVDPALLSAMSALGRVRDGTAGRTRYLPLLAAGIVALGLAGPSVNRDDAPTFRNLDGAILALDLSSSATGEGWEQLQTAARVILASLGSKPAALIVYAGDAYLAHAMTTDTTQIGLTVSLLEAGLVPDPGSRPALALARAAEVLEDAEIVAGDVVLISDGDGVDPASEAAAERIAGLGARLWTVHGGAGDALSALARAGGGASYLATEASTLAADMERGRVARLARQDFSLVYQMDLGRYLLILALIPVALLLRRRA